MIAPARTEPIAVVVKVWPKLSETFILEEILALERRGVPVRLYTLEPPSDELRHVDVDRVRAPISAVPALSSAWSGLLKATLVAALTHPWCWLRAMALAWRRGGEAWGDLLRAAHLAQQLRRDGAQRLHVHFIARTADIAELAARASGLPLSISAHAKDIYLSPPADLHRKLMAASFTVTCTEHNRRTLAEIAPQAVVRRMYHGIDHDRFHPRVRASQGAHVRRILAVGRLKAKKGLDTLVDACRLLRDQGRQVECVIVGYGDAQAALEQQIRAHDLGDVIRLAGKLPREGVIQCYATAEVFVQPSRVLADGDRDGIPNVMLEAMSMAPARGRLARVGHPGGDRTRRQRPARRARCAGRTRRGDRSPAGRPGTGRDARCTGTRHGDARLRQRHQPRAAARSDGYPPCVLPRNLHRLRPVSPT